MAELGQVDAMQLFGPRLEAADRALARNWAAQMILVTLGVVAIFGEGADLLDASRLPLGVRLDTRVASALFAMLLTYHYMRFGFLVAQFLRLRREGDDAVGDSYEPADGDATKAHPSGMFETTNFFEPIHQWGVFSRDGRTVLCFVLGATVLLAVASHVAVAAHVVRATMGSPLLLILFSLVLLTALLGCYVQMWKFLSPSKLKSLPGGRSPGFAKARIVIVVIAIGAVLAGAAYFTWHRPLGIPTQGAHAAPCPACGRPPEPGT